LKFFSMLILIICVPATVYGAGDVLRRNIFINGMDVSGMGYEAALAALSARFVFDGEIVLVADGARHAFALADFGAGYDFIPALDAAMEASMGGGLFGGIRRLFGGMRRLDFDAEYVFCEAAIWDAINQVAQKTKTAPIEPTMRRNRGRFEITDHRPGREIDGDFVHSRMWDFLARGLSAEIEIRFIDIPTNHTRADFERACDLLATHATPYLAQYTNRTTNLKVANNFIHNSLILPGEVFSTSAAMRPRIPENGYVEGGMIIDGQPAQGYGGGICQIASTLYMAALLAELEIIERAAHSLMVEYMPPATDATIAQGLIDLKFRNNTGAPILIESILRNGRHTVNIYGAETRPAGRSIAFEPRLIRETPPPPEIILRDPEIPPGWMRILAPATPGREYELYKLIYIDGKLTDEKRVNISKYRPIQGVRAYGRE